METEGERERWEAKQREEHQLLAVLFVVEFRELACPRGVGDTAGLGCGDVEGELWEVPIEGGIRSLILSSFFASSKDWILCPGSKPCRAANVRLGQYVLPVKQSA